jgi:hypothetical protein
MRDLDLVSELFHRINRIIPEDQQVLSIAPTCRVRDAVALMREHYWQRDSSAMRTWAEHEHVPVDDDLPG